jgi:hypothetical protein
MATTLSPAIHVFQDWFITARQVWDDCAYFSKTFTAEPATKADIESLIGRPFTTSLSCAQLECATWAFDILSNNSQTGTWADLDEDNLKTYIKFVVFAGDKACA